MDALAGYGSDDSSSASSAGIDNATKNIPMVSSRMTELLGDVSDESSSHKDQPKEENPTSPPRAKKPKPSSRDEIGVYLPKPILATNENNDNAICWKINYLEGPVKEKISLSGDHVPSVEEMKSKLRALSTSLPPGKNCWADHLRSQHEFHNPHFFKSVMNHFGIQEPLGSFVGASRPIQDYERLLFPQAAAETTQKPSSDDPKGDEAPATEP